MIPDEYRPILEKLYARTLNAEVIWNSISTSAFSVTVGEFSLSMSGRNWSDTDGLDFHFSLLRSTGEAIDGFELESGDVDQPFAEKLFTMVRRRALGVDDALSSVSRALDREGVIGVDLPKIEGGDDDIPF